MLHGKIATIDGVWTAIGSSNLDRRSFIYNNEVDAIVLGRETARAVEAMLRDWMSHAEPITFRGLAVTLAARACRGAADAVLEPLYVAVESAKTGSIQQIPAKSFEERSSRTLHAIDAIACLLL